MSSAAERGPVRSTVAEAAARVLRFTQVARPGDLPLILNALTTPELNAGIAQLGPRLPEAVIDYIVEHGTHAARRTLAWQLRSPSPLSPAHESARRRLLAHQDPDLDRALFGRLDQVGVTWLRAAILRDRTGPGGDAVIPPDLRAKLAGFLTTAVLPLAPSHLADTDTGDPEFELLRVLAGARDLGLALPAARVLGLPGPIPASYVQPGWRDQAWVHRWDRPSAGSRAWRLDWDEVLALAADHDLVAGDRGRFLGGVAGLDEAAAREDLPDEVRRQLLTTYPQVAWHTATPDVGTLHRIAAAVTTLRKRWGSFDEEPEFTEAIKALLIRGLSSGTLTASDILEHAVPASAVLDLAWRPADAIVPAARGRADLAEELRNLLYKRIGDDLPLWRALLVRAFVWSGTVAELVDSTAVLGPRQAIPAEADLDDAADDLPSANVLLAFARPHVGLEVLSEGPGELNDLELALLEGRPLPPGLVTRALAADAGHHARRALAANPVTPADVLDRLLHDAFHPIQTPVILLYEVADPAVRYAALELLEASGTSWEHISQFLNDLDEAEVYQLVAAAPTVERLHFLLKKFAGQLGPDTSALLYGRLAAEAGPEPVWDVATKAAGVLGDVEPFVRASMVSGDAEPLLTAAELAAQRDLPGVTVPDPARPFEPHPADPAHWPLEDAVRQHLDNRPDRWRIMVRRLMEAGPLDYAQLADLVETVGGGAGEALEGAP